MTRRDVYLLRDGMSITPVAANLMLTVLRVIIEWGIPRGYRDDNPTVGLRRLIVEDQGAQPWTEEAYAFVLASAPASLRRMAFLGRSTGQRASDLVRMRPADLLEDGINVRIGKRRDKPHFVPLTKAQMDKIRSWGVRDLEFFITTLMGKRCSAVNLNGMWNRCGARRRMRHRSRAQRSRSMACALLPSPTGGAGAPRTAPLPTRSACR